MPLVRRASIAERGVCAVNSIHPETYIGPVHYTVTDLSRQIDFYRDMLGFHVLRRKGDTAVLGTKDGDGSVDGSGGRELLHMTGKIPTRRGPGGRRGYIIRRFSCPPGGIWRNWCGVLSTRGRRYKERPTTVRI